MLAIYKREMSAYFKAPLAYVFLSAYLLLTGLFFTLGNLMSATANISYFFGNIQFITIMLLPMLTMKLFSDERRNKTDQMLITSPLSLWDIVLGKYFAACTVYFLSLCVTGIYMMIIASLGILAVPYMMVNYLGVFLLGCGVIAIGVMISAMTESQIIACVATLGAALSLQLLQYLKDIIAIPFVPTIINWLSIYERYVVFTAGILSLSAVIYMFSFCAVFVFLTVRIIEKRRWSEA